MKAWLETHTGVTVDDIPSLCDDCPCVGPPPDCRDGKCGVIWIWNTPPMECCSGWQYTGGAETVRFCYGYDHVLLQSMECCCYADSHETPAYWDYCNQPTVYPTPAGWSNGNAGTWWGPKYSWWIWYIAYSNDDCDADDCDTACASLWGSAYPSWPTATAPCGQCCTIWDGVQGCFPYYNSVSCAAVGGIWYTNNQKCCDGCPGETPT